MRGRVESGWILRGRFPLDEAWAVDEFGQVVVFHPVNPFTVSVDPVS